MQPRTNTILLFLLLWGAFVGCAEPTSTEPTTAADPGEPQPIAAADSMDPALATDAEETKDGQLEPATDAQTDPGQPDVPTQEDSVEKTDADGVVEDISAQPDTLAEVEGSEESDTAEATDATPFSDVESLPDTEEIADGEEPVDSTEGPDTLDPAEDTSEPPVELGPNLLENPGFEDGGEPWNIWGGAARVEGNAHSGDWAVQATTQNGAEQVVVNLEPNATYRLTGWGKCEGGESMGIGVKDYGGKQKQITYTEPEYQEGSLTFTTGFSNTSVVVFAYKHSGGSPGYADDVSLQLESVETHTPVWSDEFDGEGTLDETKWTYEKGFVRNQELQWYQSENAFLEDGILVIEGRTDNKPNPNYDPTGNTWQSQIETIEYTSASVITKDLYSFLYGTVVVRAKVTNYPGTWPAIWTLGTECNWPSNGEVDIMENYGGNILANFAWGTNTPWTPFWDATSWPVANFGEGWADDFHIWELKWTEAKMTIVLDGAVLNEVDLTTTVNGSAECAGQNPFQQPHFLLLNLALGSAGGSVDNLEFPTQYQVDYVRIYE